jgi:glycosyltransferase involved in cell wall biosynthesis
MKLIFLVSDLHLWGGGERVAILMANHYAAKGIETTLLSVGKPGRVFRFDIDPLVKVDYLNIPLESGWKLSRKIESVIAIRRYFHRTRKVSGPISTLNKNTTGSSPTILLALGNFPMLLAAILPKGDHLKTIGCPHSQYNAIRHIWRFLRWLLYKRLDILVSSTRWDLPNLRRQNPNVHVIPNPVTFYPEHPAKLETKLILAVGRMDYLKGYDLMLEAFERFCKTNSDWRLKIIGEGPLKSEIEKMAIEKGVANRLTISPSTNQIEKEYQAASIFLMTSRSEGLPMVLLEAQACGLPIVSFDCETGPAEIVHHGEDGFLVRPNDCDEISDRLQELANDPDKRKSFGSKARENIKRFLPDEIFKEWDEVFRGI